MCGLVGAVGNLNYNERKAFAKLLKLDTIRGPHSTGVFMAKEDGEYELIKSVGTPWDLYEEHPKHFYRTIPLAPYSVLIGHNRWATVGEINADNAHPFECGNIIGVHNGTLHQGSRFDLDPKREYETDSEGIFSAINAFGIEDTYKKLDGAWALIYYDKRDKTVRFVKNEQRPLYWSTTDNDVVFWASEKWMLEVAFETEGVTHNGIATFENHRGYYVKRDGVKSIMYVKDKEYEKKKWVWQQQPYGQHQGGQNVSPLGKSQNKPNKKITSLVSTRGSVPKVSNRKARKRAKLKKKQVHKSLKDQWMGNFMAFYVKENKGVVYRGEDTAFQFDVRVDLSSQPKLVGFFDKDLDPEDLLIGRVQRLEPNSIIGPNSNEWTVTIDPASIVEPVGWEHMGLFYEPESIEQFVKDHALVSLARYSCFLEDAKKELKGTSEPEFKPLSDEEKKILDQNCGCCDRRPEDYEFKDIHYVQDTNNFICNECYSIPQLRSMVGL